MNYPILIAGLLTGLALLAHTFIGVKETYAISPAKLADPAQTNNFDTIHRNWIQALSAFQMVTIDLLVLTALSFVLVLTDVIEPKKPIALALSVFYALWGLVWLVQVLAAKRSGKDVLLLGQWILWFICSGLMFWGAQGIDG